jgi:excisionase family DNA binding protein
LLEFVPGASRQDRGRIMIEAMSTSPAPSDERCNEDETGADTVKQFCDRFGIGRTTFYEEIRSGRLLAKKCGNRTLIPRTAGRNWLAALPELTIRGGAPLSKGGKQ